MLGKIVKGLGIFIPPSLREGYYRRQVMITSARKKKCRGRVSRPYGAILREAKRLPYDGIKFM